MNARNDIVTTGIDEAVPDVFVMAFVVLMLAHIPQLLLWAL
jgi:hypothetical protein